MSGGEFESLEMDEQVQLLQAAVDHQAGSCDISRPPSMQKQAFFRLAMGVVVGAAARAMYEAAELGEPLDLAALITSVASAVMILIFWRSLTQLLDDTIPWWGQLLTGFSLGFLGRAALKQLMEVSK